MTDLVKLTQEDGLVRIVLSRPEASNAMNAELIDAFARACEQISPTDGVRAILITAEGKNFSVGGDLQAFANAEDPGTFIEQLAERLHDGVKALSTVDAPVVIGVRGAAAGAGVGLVASGDVVIAGEGAFFTLAYGAIGLTSDGGSTWLLPRVIGLRRAQEMAYLNRRLAADEAERWGLVTRVVPDDAVEDEALAIARRLASGPTRAFGAVRRLFAASYGATLADQVDAEARSMGAAMRTGDAQGAVRAFLARERPVFTGR